MLFKSSLLAQASGSLSGTVFSHNRGGQYTRNRSIPTDPASVTQLQRRDAFREAVNAWSSINTADREGWDNYAANTPWLNKLGDTTHLTGQQQAIRSGVIMRISGEFPGSLALGLSVFPDVYGLPAVGNITITSVSQATNSVVVAIGAAPLWASNPTDGILIFAGIPQSTSRSYYGGPYRFIDTKPGNATPVTTDTENLNQADPGIVVTQGQRIWFRFVVYREAPSGGIYVSTPVTVGPTEVGA